MPNKPLLAVTIGDPSGVGPEVVAKALQNRAIYDIMRPVLVGTVNTIKNALNAISSSDTVISIDSALQTRGEPGTIEVVSPADWEGTNFPVGKHDAGSGSASHLWVEEAAKMCIAGDVDGMVTAPVNKESWNMGGSKDTGHMEVFRRLTGSRYVATMLVSGPMRCMHLSTHKSLGEAVKYVTTENILTAVRLTNEKFNEWGSENPRIAVAALNPHASDNGLIGSEEADEIAPAVAQAVSEGIDASGPHPADTVFNSASAGKYDVVVVMYHDQGHIPIKVYGVEESVTVNLGIPFLRTSVDHGTAFDIAGVGIASEVSMIEAIKLGTSLASRKGLAT
ncbi:MAG TPA: 4-hydroxythreonine-4-phosphate dehydrogenase PdxA [Dehalococcoidia bacterium]|jgi:4-hydroxythreonine-4-phosphate dehydrogenase|nr:4-hydroxythreonine-4-phosphate dehydrogenase PdxA [Chloroflexota bacterium]MDP6055665.1 4-hydroxythreonine-4-phosphate dehydrogenase PdxA [Dehalococcoidia bacterium]MDP7090170.1 4-hydroxythreonine-4-phosphate dehydrogenase PdxA [Dehalococcoidia bacterium]MDP7261254.1 4-hydroxythreonine-4-phosphate dehydrogenase PdxA [Dehalococcoidia bacterium]MDP7485380.1 4-hydroxythreonine-4-phosphate dehydrogenase PdxA [Dehalococcoidia bacterium]|tara:strand:+ start:268 stop:1275 length:1008 start_codon:yes stop_codon:yes gene_type:complete